jgi:hypothetical protein
VGGFKFARAQDAGGAGGRQDGTGLLSGRQLEFSYARTTKEENMSKKKRWERLRRRKRAVKF